MARIARIVVPGLPHHVTQRGNRGEPIFFEPADYELYRDLLAASCRKAHVAVWAYCLMPNHVHLLLVPKDATGLARALGETHRRYAGYVNARARRTGHLFQGRFSSVAMDEAHLLASARHVSLNPVRARLVKRAKDWAWSSVRAHLKGADDSLVTARPLLDRVGRFADLLARRGETDEFAALRAAETIGRPVGSPAFLARLSRKLGRSVEPRKRGRKPQAVAEGSAGAKEKIGGRRRN
jgi:putative transposase